MRRPKTVDHQPARAKKALVFSKYLPWVAALGIGFTPLQSQAGSVSVVELTAEQIQIDYAAGAYTPLELTQSFLDRIENFEPTYNAFISLNDNALARAQELTEQLKAGGPTGPLFGVPVVIKDNIDQVGQVTTGGSTGFSTADGGLDINPQDSAEVVDRLEAAGAIILGKTNMPDFAFSGTRSTSTIEGVTLNPYNIEKVPGGSSGGTATAVNASFAVLGLGTETGGSIENPASAQALVGVKPTFGLVPLEGVLPIDATFRDVVGPLAKTVTDAAITLDVLAGSFPEDPATIGVDANIPSGGYTAGLSTTALEGKKFGLVGPGWRGGLPSSIQFLPLAPETDAFYQAAIADLEAQGASVVTDPFAGTGFAELYARRPSAFGFTFDVDIKNYLEGLGDGANFNSVAEYEAITGRPFPIGGVDNPVDNLAAVQAVKDYIVWQAELIALFEQVLEDNDLDGLFFPQAGSPIPPLDEPGGGLNGPNSFPELPSNIINDLTVPVVTLPYGYYDDNTPFVLSFIGNKFTDGELLAYAYDLEQATLARVAPTLIPTPSAVFAGGLLLAGLGARRRRRG